MEKYGLLVKMTVDASSRDGLAEIMLEASVLMKQAEGCLSYLVHLDRDVTDILWVTDGWENEGTHEKSLEIDGVAELISRARPMIKGIDMTRLASYWV